MKSNRAPIFFDCQRKWIADKSPIKIGVKSRRIGFTWSEAFDDVCIAARSKAAGGMNILYISTNKDAAREYIIDAERWAMGIDCLASKMGTTIFEDRDKDIYVYYLKFKSGYRIMALSSRPSNIRGKQGVVVIDEAAYHDDLDALLKAARALRIWGGKIRVISTHNGVENPFNALVEQVEKGNMEEGIYSLHKVTFDQALADGLYKRVCQMTGEVWTKEKEAKWREAIILDYGDDALEELFCTPSNSNKSYFRGSILDRAMDKDHSVYRANFDDSFEMWDEEDQIEHIYDILISRFDPIINGIPGSANTFIGWDFARSSHVSSVSLIVRLKDDTTFCPLIIELRNCPFNVQRHLGVDLISRLPGFTKGVFDARGNGSYLAETIQKQFGSYLIEALSSDQHKWSVLNVPRYRTALEIEKLKIPFSDDLKKDHLGFQEINGIPLLPKGFVTYDSEGKPRHGDSAMSLILAYSGVPDLYTEPEEIDITPPLWLGSRIFTM